MATRDMTDDELMQMMAQYTDLLIGLSSMTRNDFFSYLRRDVFVELGVSKALELVGEAAFGVSQSGRAAYPDIDFAKWEEMRHDIVHDYGGILISSTYQTITYDVPDLYSKLRSYKFINF